MLSTPSFDGNLGWSFGHLTNDTCNISIDQLHRLDVRILDKPLSDQLITVFGQSLVLKNEQLTQFCEIVSDIYAMIALAKILNKANTLIMSSRVADINNNLIPMQIKTLWALLDTVE